MGRNALTDSLQLGLRRDLLPIVGRLAYCYSKLLPPPLDVLASSLEVAKTPAIGNSNHFRC